MKLRALILAAALALPGMVFAQASKAKPGFKAQVRHSEASVFKAPDFDSEIIAVLEEGKVFSVSQKKVNGAFYKILVRPGVVGYISDADVKPLFKTSEKNSGRQSGSRIDAERLPPKSKRSFQYTQYVGPQFSSISYKEDTMGSQRTDTQSFFGLKLSGPDLVIEGAFQTDVNLQFSSGAPSYYEQSTGNSADGLILLMDFRMQSYTPHGKDTLTFFGFGPVFRYSKFNVTLTDSATTKNTSYSLEDMALGAVFNLGAAVRLGKVALRGELQYYWEKMQYLGGGLSLQFPF